MKQYILLLSAMMGLLTCQASAQAPPPPPGWQLISSVITFTCNYTYEGDPYTSTGAGAHEFKGSFNIQHYDITDTANNVAGAPWSTPFRELGIHTVKVDYDVTVTFTAAGQAGWPALNTKTYDGDETWMAVPSGLIDSRHTFYDVQNGLPYGMGPY